MGGAYFPLFVHRKLGGSLIAPRPYPLLGQSPGHVRDAELRAQPPPPFSPLSFSPPFPSPWADR